MTPLQNITRAELAPIWARKDINTATVAAALGVSVAGLHHKADRLNLPKRGAGKVEVDAALFAAMWSQGVLGSDMAKHFGYSSYRGVWVRAQIMGLAKKPRMARKTRVTVQQVLETFMGARLQECANETKRSLAVQEKRVRA